MIPPIIHYCWFGKNEKPKIVKKCIRSWRKNCPNYEIIEWNEENLDFDSVPELVKEIYKTGKWAFVTDYIRYQIVYQYGGVYLDTDVQLLKSLDPFLENEAFFGFEKNSTCVIASGLGFGAEKGNRMLEELMRIYEESPVLKEGGKLNLKSCVDREAECFKQHGLVQNGQEQLIDYGVHIYPDDYFCPFDWMNRRLRITERTVSIHWYSASWYSKEERRLQNIRRRKRKIRYFCHFPLRICRAIIGYERYERIKQRLRRFPDIRHE